MNCQSLVNKKGPFYNLVDSSKPDIIIATETWFNKDIKDSEYFSSNFTVYRRDRHSDRIGGGILIAVNSTYISSREEKLEFPDTEMLWVKINIVGCKTLYVGACYRPKTDDSDSLENLEKALGRIKGDKSSVIIGGDFNLPGWDWRNNGIKPKSPHPAVHSHFGEILNDNGLQQTILEPTRGENILDLIITNRPNQINRTQILPGIGDHNIPYTELSIKPARGKQTPRELPLYDRADWHGLRDHMSKIAQSVADKEVTESSEGLWTVFRDGILHGIKTYIPHKWTKSRESCPWIDSQLKRLLRRRDRAFKASKASGRARDETKFQTLKKLAQRKLRQAYWNYIEGIVSPQTEDKTPSNCMKRFWTYIKNRKTDFNGIAPLKVNGKLFTEPKARAEVLNDQFQSVFTRETPPNLTPPRQQSPTMPDIEISVEGVLKLLKNLKPNKASGPDNIGPRVLKELADIIADPLTRIFRRSLRDGQVPRDWKHARVAPIFKKGQKYDPANYRPISLTCVTSKLMEHIICSNLMEHASQNNILYSLQHGFRERRSCETQLIEFVNDVVASMQDGLQTDVCVLDFSKAFDKVGHQRLLHKLEWYGVRGTTNQWIRSFLEGRTQSVVVEGAESDRVPVLSGVPQGSVLGPCLFLYYINDIALGLTSTTRLFADDTMIYMTVRNNSDARKLQDDLRRLEEWEDTWMMEFHPHKCEVVSITRKKSPVIFPYTLHGHTLDHVQVVKYLGVTISNGMRWDAHVNNITGKANRTLGFLRRNLNISNIKIKQQAYHSLVRPILEYGSSVWNPYTDTLTNKIEAVQRRAARFVLQRYRRTSSVGNMIGELDWQSLEERRRVASLMMFFKVHNNLVATEMPGSLTPKQHVIPTRKENSLAYQVPGSTRDYHRMSFFPRTARLWNSLPDSTVRRKSPESFREALLAE